MLTIIEGIVLDFYLHFKVIHRKYYQTYESTSNAINLHTTDAIALGPNGNLQGGMRCFSLDTDKILQWA